MPQANLTLSKGHLRRREPAGGAERRFRHRLQRLGHEVFAAAGTVRTDRESSQSADRIPQASQKGQGQSQSQCLKVYGMRLWSILICEIWSLGISTYTHTNGLVTCCSSALPKEATYRPESGRLVCFADLSCAKARRRATGRYCQAQHQLAITHTDR